LKKLILIRHAKSSWDHNVSDLNRPLSNRGFDDANLMSGILNNFSIDIDAVFSSNSKRTFETAKIFLNNLVNYKNLKIVQSSNLYDFYGDKLDLFIKNLNNEFNTVMIFSHNNSCNNLLFKYGGVINKHVPTSGILIFEFDVSLWSDVITGNCNYFFPKNFK
jgi:phosphohistidine phosphatase|tara:strand:- start:4981 stop:5466 length:486 start_codon:yes stop_codon:yes gene_type:complete